jgi:hypothetical protein
MSEFDRIKLPTIIQDPKTAPSLDEMLSGKDMPEDNLLDLENVKDDPYPPEYLEMPFEDPLDDWMYDED